MPFFIRTGKRMKKRVTEIVVKFRRPPVWMFHAVRLAGCAPQHAAPDDPARRGIRAYFHIKAPGKPLKLERLPLDFFYKERFQELPEAYQTLLLDVVEGDQTLFVHADEVEAAWRLFTPILDNTLAVAFYAAGRGARRNRTSCYSGMDRNGRMSRGAIRAGGWLLVLVAG